MTIDKITQAEKDKIFAKMINHIRSDIRHKDGDDKYALLDSAETAGYILYEFLQDKVQN